MSELDPTISYGFSHNGIIDSNKRNYLEWLEESYDDLMENSTIITNSQYNQKAIFDTYGIDFIVVSPPVDVETFGNASLMPFDDKREDIVLVISRIDPLKKIKNAISLAKGLKENRIGKEMIIVGSLDMYYYDYYLYIKK